MSLWVKICANTSLADALLDADAGADAVGFVLAPSPRRVTPEQVAAITPHLPATLEKIGVFVEGSLDEIANVVERCALTGVQLHSNFGPEVPTALRERFGKDLRILRVVHFGTDAGSEILTLAENPNLDGILVDSKTATAVGGTGVVFDWKSARETVFGTYGTDLKLIAAGGLNPANVGEAIASLDPWGVDVASGVEQSPGCKDPAKVREFIRNARAAGRGVDRKNH